MLFLNATFLICYFYFAKDVSFRHFDNKLYRCSKKAFLKILFKENCVWGLDDLM